jgi:Tol biopolymer transport system component
LLLLGRIEAGRSILLGAMLVAILAFLPASAAVAAFPGDNGRIAYSGRLGTPHGEIPHPEDEPFNIFTILPDGSGRQQLTHVTDPNLDSLWPSWSPDGRSLVFVREDYWTCATTGPDDISQVIMMNADGSNETRIIDVGWCRPSPSFSPSGQRIAYTTGTKIFSVRTDGTDRRLLAKGCPFNRPGTRLCSPGSGETVCCSRWSPAGRRIAFAGQPKGRHRYGIWTVRRDGSRLRPIDAKAAATTIDYSPDGQHLVFDPVVNGSIQIYLVGADGSGQHVIPGTDHLSHPAYAPAGDRIVLSHVLTVAPGAAAVLCADLYTISPAGSEGQPITHNCSGGSGFSSGVADMPTWQPAPGSG